MYKNISVANYEYHSIKNTIDQNLKWDCAIKNETYTRELEELGKKLEERIEEMIRYDEDMVLDIGRKAAAGDFHWFINYDD